MPWVFVLIWSTGFVVARLAMPHSPPFTFLICRFALSALCFALWIVLAGVAWPRGRRQWLHLAVTGVLMQTGYLGGVWSAVKGGIGAGTVALLAGLQPVLTALWISRTGHAVLPQGPGIDAPEHEPRSKVSRLQWLGLLLGLAGLTLVVWRKLGGSELTPLNLGLALLALLSITVGTLYQKRFVAPCDVRSAGAVQMLAAFAVSVPIALFENEPMVWHPQLVVAMTWSVLVLTLGGSSLLYLLIQRGAATSVTSLMYLVPPTTALLAWLLFDESLSAAMGVGMALTVAGVALVMRPQRADAVQSERQST